MTTEKVITVALASLLLAACGGGEEDVAGEAGESGAIVLSEQDVATVRAGDLAAGVTLSGSLDPYQVVEVRAQVPGIVQDLRVDRGDAVARRAVMATIEAEGIRGQASGARAGVAAAEANFALARQQLASARTLYEAGALSEIDYRGAQAGYEAARAQLAAARGQAAGASEQARRATVTSPIAGQVSRRSVSAGEAVNPGQPLFTVVDTRFLELSGQVPVTEAAAIRPGQPVEFNLVSQPGRALRGEVARVEPTADPTTRQVGVYLRLANEGGALVGGQYATGRVITGTTTEAALVPASAVRERAGQSFVWVIADGQAARRPVTVTGRDPVAGVVALTGVQPGERVVVAAGELEEGARVQIGASAARQSAGEE